MLNIKNRDTEAAVRTLANQLGTGLTEAIHQAVQHELQRLADDRALYLDQLQQAATRVRAASDPQTWLSATDLYDEAGLPQ